jgi:hypothetical protein
MTRCKRARAGCPRHSGRDARATSEGSASFSSRDSNRAAEAAQKLLGEGAFLLRRQLFESLQQGLGVAAHAPIIAGILTYRLPPHRLTVFRFFRSCECSRSGSMVV